MRRLLLPLALLFIAGCAAPRPATAPAPDAHPGFDTWAYPGDAALAAWREASPYRWIGYYLPSPCHRGTTWQGKRETIERLGWGIAVLYVGQQTFDGVPDEETDGPILCSRTLLTAEQGRTDARDAVAKASAEGFPPGSVVFLNVERAEAVTDSLASYYAAWVRELLADNRFLPGTYAHRRNAADLLPLAQAAYREAGRAEAPPFWVAASGEFDLNRAPHASGLPFAEVWQGTFDVEREWGGVRLTIDENVAARPYPSAPPVTEAEGGRAGTPAGGGR